MKLLRPILLLLFGIFSCLTNANAGSLREAINTALTTNPKIDAAQASRRATEFVLKQAQGRFLPEVDISGDIGKEYVDSPTIRSDLQGIWRRRKQATLKVSQILFDGWDRANDVYRSQARISAASFKVLARSELLGLSVTEAYIDVVRHRALLDLSKNNVKRHRELLTLIRQRFEGGKAPIGDVEQTIERVEAAKVLVATIKIALETAIAKYKNSVGENPGKLNSVRRAPGIPVSAKSAIAEAISNNPRIHAAGADIDVADFEKKQFRSSFLPKLSFEGTAIIGEDLGGTPGRTEELRGLVVLSWKLFDGGIRMNRDFELAERHAEKIAEQEILARQIVQEIEISWARHIHGQAQVNSLRSQVAQNERVLATYQDEYTANKRSLLDLLDAENSKFGSQFALSNTKALHLFSGYQILAHSGTLLSNLGIVAPSDVFVIGAPTYSEKLFKTGRYDFDIPPLQ